MRPAGLAHGLPAGLLVVVLCGGCALTATRGKDTFGLYPGQAPQANAITYADGTVVAIQAEASGYGILIGYKHARLTTIPVSVCREGEVLAVPSVVSSVEIGTQATAGATQIGDTLTVGGAAARPAGVAGEVPAPASEILPSVPPPAAGAAPGVTP